MSWARASAVCPSSAVAAGFKSNYIVSTSLVTFVRCYITSIYFASVFVQNKLNFVDRQVPKFVSIFFKNHNSLTSKVRTIPLNGTNFDDSYDFLRASCYINVIV